MSAPPPTAANQAPAWHARLARQLKAIDRDPGLAAACRRGCNTEPLDVLDMHGPLSYVLEGDEDTPLADYVPPWRREEVCAAAHYTLALYACHRQSATAPVHRYGVTLGEAVRRLQAAMPSKGGAATRFRAALSADTTDELTSHLRFLVSLLRTYSIALDYVALADALAAWQHPARRNGLRRRWGMEFRRTPPKTSAADSSTASPQE
ncbi:type I-E CRISPR-associated protein Cse2/CasB [Streptomyces sp. NPDC057654]|uniref:type I-E CRISPR-associated protein Cse2/CasB n=1 Tax=Streptomyces sp. NPDC057654 TaxID=3346196 RepID=UPI0036C5E3DA